MIDATATARDLTIGAGTPFRFSRWPSGFLSTATTRSVDQPAPNRNGLVAGRDLLGGKVGAFELVINAWDQAQGEALLAELRTAFKPSGVDEWLYLRIAGDPAEYAIRGRYRGVVAGFGRRFIGGKIEARCTFVATDPVLYGPESSDEIGLAAHTIPATLPFILGLYGNSTIIVDGEADIERWTVTFQAPAGGPLVNPRILHLATDQLIQVDRNVPANNRLVLDGYSGRALLGVAAPEIVPTAVSQWFALTPGSNSLRFSAADGSHVDSTATITWRPGYS